MEIFDITRPISESMINFPGLSAPCFRQEDRGLYLITDLQLSSHSGTHVDAPVHYLKQGETIDHVPLQNLVGPCRVLDLGGIGSEIGPKHLAGKIDGASRILLKTPFSFAQEFDPDFPHLGLEAARRLVKQGVACIGIDSPSIEALHCDGAVHRELLGNECIVIEMLDLSRISEGDYFMAALPLPLAGIDGAPARVVLFQGDDYKGFSSGRR